MALSLNTALCVPAQRSFIPTTAAPRGYPTNDALAVAIHLGPLGFLTHSALAFTRDVHPSLRAGVFHPTSAPL